MLLGNSEISKTPSAKKVVYTIPNGVFADPRALFYKPHRKGGEHTAYKRADRKRYADYVRNGNPRNHRMR